MLQRGKRILACGVLLGSSLGAAGFLVTPKASSRPAPVQPIAARPVEARPTVRTEKTFELLKARGKPLFLSARVRHIYRVDLRTGQLLQATIQQRGIDVRLEVFGPAKKLLLVVDSPNSNKGQEPVLLVAETTGTYEISVTTSVEPQRGTSYVVDTAQVTPSSERDRRKAVALGSYFRAREMGRHEGGNLYKKALLSAEAALGDTGQWYLQAKAGMDLGKLYRDEGAWEKAVAIERRAAGLFHRLGQKAEEAGALHELGISEQQTFEIDKALGHWESAQALAHAAGAQRPEAIALATLGMFYAERADAWRAGRYLQEAVRLSKRCGDAAIQARALSGFGLLYTNLRQNEKAQEVYLSALRIPGLDPRARAEVLTQMGNAYIYDNKPDLAIQCFQKAYPMQKGGRDPDNEASTLVGFGLTLVAMRDLRGALGSYGQALKIYQVRNDLRNQSILLMNIGWTLGLLNRYEGARESFDRALFLSRKLKNPLLEAGAFLGSGWIERHRGNLSEAQRRGEQALKLIESMRKGTQDREDRVSFFSGKQDIYDLLINVLMDQYERKHSPDLLAKALQTSERARARDLLDILGQRDRPSSGPSMRILTLRDIQQQVLDPETILLEYSLGREKSYLWLVTQDKIERFVLPDREQIESLAGDAYEKLQRSHLPGRKRAAAQATLKLSRVLLGPVADQLGKLRLLIVTSGALQSIPFGVLPDPRSQLAGAGSQTWPEPLLVQHELVYEPSASALAEIRRVRVGRQTATGLLAALGDPLFKRKNQRGSEGGSMPQEVSDPFWDLLSPLPGSRREVDAITAGLPSQGVLKAVGADANRDLVTSGKLEDYKVLHLATHSFYPAGHPEFAAIVLSRFDARGKPREGLLRIKDIASLNFRADLVALSSCSSALGKNVLGEGTVGWSHAFLAAGASSVVTSVWDVEDESTAKLMPDMYQNIFSRHMSPSQALREAQISMWKNPRRNAPWFWAGFIAQGEWQNLVISLNKNSAAVSPQRGDSRSPSTTATEETKDGRRRF
jgi:CHAT domain-containing protein/Tfp pilus assembly protein PilF